MGWGLEQTVLLEKTRVGLALAEKGKRGDCSRLFVTEGKKKKKKKYCRRENGRAEPGR
jgi:hypothetical protein